MARWAFLKWKNFRHGTKAIAMAVAEATAKGAFSAWSAVAIVLQR